MLGAARIQTGRRLPAVVQIVDAEIGHAVQIVFELTNGHRVAFQLLTVRLIDVDLFLCDFDVLAVWMSIDEVERAWLITVVVVRLGHKMMIVSQFAFDCVRVIHQQRMVVCSGRLVGVVIWQWRRWRNVAGIVVRMTESVFVHPTVVVCTVVLSVHCEVWVCWQCGRATIQMLVWPVKCHIAVCKLCEIAAK